MATHCPFTAGVAKNPAKVSFVFVNIRLHSACLSLKTTTPERENRNKDRKSVMGVMLCVFSAALQAQSS